MKINVDLLDTLFTFPIIMVDGDNEEKKHRSKKRLEELGLDEEDDEQVDIIIGEADCPYFDFLSVTDRWLPTSESVNRAIEGKFEACFVMFSQSGNYVVPWNKEKFKEELRKFIESRAQQVDDIRNI